MSPRKLTPEATSTSEVLGYLRAIGLGKYLRRQNVGQVRVGNAPTHPWQKDTRRVMRFGENGASDYRLEFPAGDPRIPAHLWGRNAYLEIKRADWKAPTSPKPGAAKSTREKFAHHLAQVRYLAEQADRGNPGGFVRTAWEVFELLSSWGFEGIARPARMPQEAPNAPRRPSSMPRTK